MKVTILDDYFDTLRSLPSFEMLKDHEVAVLRENTPDPDKLALQLADTEALVLIRERTAITSALLNQLPKLRLISQRSVYPHIDVEACTRNGVLLCSNMHAGTPSYAAAELTWGLILASMRQIPQQMASLQAGHWQRGVGKTLRGRTLGLYGYGRIARVVSGYAKEFGMNVVWWSSEEGRTRASNDGETVAADRQAFFAESDVVSVHVRLKPTTRGIITRQDLGWMSPEALFVNTSRAGIVQTGALLDALNAGRPGQAAVDVFDDEPVTSPNDPLVSHSRMTCTPHVGYVTEDEWDLQFTDIYEQIVAYAAGSPINMINAEVWARTTR